MKYETENEILELIKKFEDGTFSRNEWNHAAHLTVGFHYLSTHDFAQEFSIS